MEALMVIVVASALRASSEGEAGVEPLVIHACACARGVSISELRKATTTRASRMAPLEAL